MNSYRYDLCSPLPLSELRGEVMRTPLHIDEIGIARQNFTLLSGYIAVARAGRQCYWVRWLATPAAPAACRASKLPLPFQHRVRSLRLHIDLTTGKIQRRRVLGGLINKYKPTA